MIVIHTRCVLVLVLSIPLCSLYAFADDACTYYDTIILLYYDIAIFQVVFTARDFGDPNEQKQLEVSG